MSIVLDWNWSGQIIVPMIDDGLKVDLNPFLDKDWNGGATHTAPEAEAGLI